MISVDGDTSTNDTCLLLANGMAENTKITEKNADYETFTKALRFVNETLAKQMAGDGEGATALFEVKVIGAETKEQAKILKQIRHHIKPHQSSHLRTRCKLGQNPLCHGLLRRTV